jgi:hypothetical protein
VHYISMAQQCNQSAESRRQGICPSAAEEVVVVVVETPSLRCFQHVGGTESRPSVQLNLC